MGIKRKMKQCIECGNKDYIFSKGRCKSCANKAYSKTIIDNRLLKVGSKKKLYTYPTGKYRQRKSAERIAMETFWKLEASKDINGRCFCQEAIARGATLEEASLGTEFNPYCVAHIISKGSNPKFQSDMRNFILLSPKYHNMFDGKVDGQTRKDMLIFERTEVIRIKLKNEDRLYKK